VSLCGMRVIEVRVPSILTSCHSHSLSSSLSCTDCPQGPFHPALDGRRHHFEDEAPDQWAPVSNNFNQWISVGTPDDGGPTPCVDYGDLNHGQAPLWGLDATAASSKLRLLCCDGRRNGLRAGREHEARQATRLPAP